MTLDIEGAYSVTERAMPIIEGNVCYITVHTPDAPLIALPRVTSNQYLPLDDTSALDCRDLIVTHQPESFKEFPFTMISDEFVCIAVGKEPEGDEWSLEVLHSHDTYGVKRLFAAFGNEEEITQHLIDQVNGYTR